MKLQQVANEVTLRVNDVALRANGFFQPIANLPKVCYNKIRKAVRI